MLSKSNFYKYLRSFQQLRNIVRKVKHFWRSFILTFNGYKVIKMIDIVFAEEQIEYFFSYGTLLGFVRQGSIIKHDYDLDVIVLLNTIVRIQDIETKIRDLILVKFNKRIRFVNSNIFNVMSFFIMGVKVDISFFYPQIDNPRVYLVPFINKDGIKADIKIDTIIRVDFNKTKLSIPNNYIEIIEHLYGNNWHLKEKYPF